MNPDPQTVPGVEADRPSEIPRPGWFQIVKRAWKESKEDSVPLLSAGVAFYAFLALVPTLIAIVMIYGLVSDADEVADQVESFGSALPSSAEDLLSEQMTTLANASERSLSVGLVIALGFALWSASGGISNLITAVNVAYDEKEKRGFVKSRALALGMTVGAIVFVIVAVALVAAIPVVLDALDVPGWVEAVADVGRWLGLVVVVLIALALLYRWAPDRDAPKFRWLSFGAIVATVLWVVASIGFSVYVDNFASYGKTYGSLAGVIVLLLWLWLGAYATLLGAEVNAEMEQQTIKDTTKGEPRPLGQRGAVKADSIPGDEGTVAPAACSR
ncbi:MAG TPA: YihY/virulence factor BrkB family protein [Jiangellaceae bacterium]|nr:YihY/virulence factor BrkB family protein [Jiangellaceae bacterium]